MNFVDGYFAITFEVDFDSLSDNAMNIIDGARSCDGTADSSNTRVYLTIENDYDGTSYKMIAETYYSNGDIDSIGAYFAPDTAEVREIIRFLTE